MGRNFLWHICRSVCTIIYLLINFSDVINECRIMTLDEYPDNDFVLHARQRSITPRQSNSKFSSRQHARFHQLTRMDTAFARFESARLISLGYLARTWLQRKAWTICESQRSSECYQRQMARCRWPDSQKRLKSYIAVEKAFSSCGKAEWNTYSAHFLLNSLLIGITVTFWCSLRTTNNINDEQLANIVLWRAMLFRLYITANMEAF